MFSFLKRAHWADFMFDNKNYVTHRIMCNRCGHIVSETSLDKEKLLDTGDESPLSYVGGVVIDLPKKCPTCGKRMKNSGEYSIIPEVV